MNELFYRKGTKVLHTAISDEGIDGYTKYTKITSDLTKDEIKEIVYTIREMGYGDRCYHEHDCCGCEFLVAVSVLEEHPTTDLDGHFVIKESWGINV